MAWNQRVQAAESAIRLLDELSIDQSEQIDVFGMCEELHLWLAFVPMDNLLGVFVPEGAGGVLVTTQRPIPLQRYTAAHEIGHWRLEHGHGLAFDGEEHILGTTSDEREQLAQVFAGNLLMPVPLVFGVLDRLGVNGQTLAPEHAYAVAREAGVSYEAAVRQLRHLDVITSARATALRQRRPLQVKADLALGRRPVSGYADVWPVNEDWNDHLLTLRVEDEVVISLPENRSTGYRWMLPDEQRRAAGSPPPALEQAPPRTLDATAIEALQFQFERAGGSSRVHTPRAALQRLQAVTRSKREFQSVPAAEIVGDEYIPGRVSWLSSREVRRRRIAEATAPNDDGSKESGNMDEPIVAATGRRLLSVRFAHPGAGMFRLDYQSPYNDEAPVEQYVLRTVVEPRRVGFSVDQLAKNADEPWTAQVRERKLKRPLEPLEDSDDSDPETEKGPRN